MAVVVFPTYHFGVWLGHFLRLRILQFTRSWLFVYSRRTVAVDFGCASIADSGGVLDIHVFDGVRQTNMVGVADCVVAVVRHTSGAWGITF